MANTLKTEKKLLAISPQVFTANGTALGKVTLAATKPFKVKQQVIIRSSAIVSSIFEVKRIESDTVLYVGPLGGKISDRSDLSAYLVVDGANISAEEQNRPNVPEQEIERLTYEEEPTIARRVFLVDQYGNPIDSSNPLAVDATVNISGSNPDTPTIFNVVATTSGTEYFQALPANTVRFRLKARNNAKLQIAYTLGATSSNFLTIIPGNIYEVNDVNLVGKVVYFTSSKDDTIVEIETWN